MNISFNPIRTSAGRRSNRKLVRAFLVAAGVIGLLASQSAQAASNKTWSGATDNNFNVGTNWGGTVPASGDNLIFTSGMGLGGLTLNDNLMTPGTYTLGSITFNAGAAAFIINPNTPGTNGFTMGNNLINNSTSLETINDSITLGTSVQFQMLGGGGVTIGGAISGGSNITSLGSGTLTLSAASNGYTGTTTVAAGSTLALTGGLTGGGAITVQAGGNMTESGSGLISGASSLTVSGNTTFSGLNTYTGATTVSSALALDFSGATAPATASNIIKSGNAITLTSGALTIIAGGSNSQTFGTTTLTGSTANLISTNLNGGTALNLTLGNLSRGAQSTADITFSTGSGKVTGVGTATNGILTDSNGVAYATANGGASWVANSAGTLTALGSYSSTYTAANNVDVTSGDSKTGVTVNTLRFNAANDALSLSGSNIINTGGILVTKNGVGSSIGAGGTIQAGAGKEMVIHDYSTINIGAGIADSTSGTSSLTHDGSGITTLSAASNTYTGATVNSGGTLIVTGSLATSGITVSAGSLVLKGSAPNVTGTTSITGGSLTLYQGNSAGTSLISFQAAATGSLTTAVLNLRNDSDTTYTNNLMSGVAGTVINVDQATAGNTGHTLALGNFSFNKPILVTNGNGYNLSLGAGSSPNSATPITNNMISGTLTLASFTYSSSSAGTLSNFGTSSTGVTAVTGALSQSGAGALNVTQNSAGTLLLGSSNPYTGTTTVTYGALKSTTSSGNPFGSGTMAITNGTLALAPSGTGSDVALVGGTLAAATPFTFNQGAILSLDRGSQSSLTYTFGNSGATFARGTNGTLILSAGDITKLGETTANNGERFIINGTAPTLVNNIVNGAVGQDRTSGNNLNGDFLTYNATTGFKKASYDITDTFTGSTNTKVVNITNTSTTAASSAAYALKVSGTVNNTNNTLTLGSVGNTAGLILNGGVISGGTLTTTASSTSEFVVYVNSMGGTISSAVTTQTSQAGMSVFGPGALTLSSSNSFTGGLRINASSVIATNDNQLGDIAGAITLNGGTLQTSGAFSLGNTGQRSISLVGAQLVGAGQPNTGGILNITSGTTTYTTSVTTGKVINGTGSLTKTGAGTLVLAGNISNTYTGGTIVNNGTLQLGASDMLANTGVVVVNGGTFDVQGFNDTVSGITLTSGSIIGSGGTLTSVASPSVSGVVAGFNAGNFEMQAGKVTANLSGNVALNKTTGGTVTLAGVNTYTGATNITAGTLIVSGSISGSGANVNGDVNTTLSGNGSITPLVTLTAGRIAPGINISGSNSNFGAADTIHLGTSGGFSLMNAKLDFDLASTAALASDKIITGGALSLSSTMAFTFNELSAGVLETGVAYTLIQGATSFSGFDAASLAANTVFLNGNYTPTFSMNGNDLQVTFAAVPEPTTWVMMLSGLGLLSFWQRNRRWKA